VSKQNDTPFFYKQGYYVGFDRRVPKRTKKQRKLRARLRMSKKSCNFAAKLRKNNIQI
jgi:hypothetical protein